MSGADRRSGGAGGPYYEVRKVRKIFSMQGSGPISDGPARCSFNVLLDNDMIPLWHGPAAAGRHKSRAPICRTAIFDRPRDR